MSIMRVNFLNSEAGEQPTDGRRTTLQIGKGILQVTSHRQTAPR